MSKNALLSVGFVLLALAVASILFIFNNKDDSTVSNTVEIEQTPLTRETSPASKITKQMYKSPPPILDADEITGKKARIKTAKGDIVFEFLPDAPMAASNFIFLANEKFYDNLTFHRREEGFVIQGGDPNGNGTGGPGYKFEDEKVTKDYKKGIVAMANSGPNTNGSQFFIMLEDYPLPKNYTIFGQVVEGQDIVDAISVGDIMQKVTIE